MALSEDQKAILRLLAQRGAAGYDDLAALLGTSVADVHARAKAAGEQLEGEGIPAPAIPDPPGRGGPAGDPTAEDRPHRTHAGTDVSRLPEPSSEGSPAPETKPEDPDDAASRKEPTAALPPGEPRPPLRKELKLPAGRGLWAVLAGVAIVVLFVVILVVSGGGDGDSTTSSSSPAGGETTTASNGKELTQATLNPVDGSEASGKAIFGQVKKNLALQVFAEGLQPTGNGESYAIWLSASPQKMLPLALTKVKADGQIRVQVEVPVEVLAYLANGSFEQIAVTRTDKSRLEASLAKATKDKKAPLYTGDEVLRGTVTGPIVGAAQ